MKNVYVKLQKSTECTFKMCPLKLHFKDNIFTESSRIIAVFSQMNSLSINDNEIYAKI